MARRERKTVGRPKKTPTDIQPVKTKKPKAKKTPVKKLPSNATTDHPDYNDGKGCLNEKHLNQLIEGYKPVFDAIIRSAIIHSSHFSLLEGTCHIVVDEIRDCMVGKHCNWFQHSYSRLTGTRMGDTPVMPFIVYSHRFNQNDFNNLLEKHIIPVTVEEFAAFPCAERPKIWPIHQVTMEAVARHWVKNIDKDVFEADVRSGNFCNSVVYLAAQKPIDQIVAGAFADTISSQRHYANITNSKHVIRSGMYNGKRTEAFIGACNKLFEEISYHVNSCGGVPVDLTSACKSGLASFV